MPPSPEPVTVLSLDHVQLAMPAGREEDARAFYAGVLGMDELPKPESLASRGGCWFQSGSAILHLGVEEPFAPARKAHPALRVANLDTLQAALCATGAPVIPDDTLPGVRRCFTADPFGNRIELIAGAASGRVDPAR